jgi:hypothetical protein
LAIVVSSRSRDYQVLGLSAHFAIAGREVKCTGGPKSL